MVPLPECQHIAKSLQDISDRGVISCIGKLFKENRVYCSLCIELLPQQMSQSKNKNIDLCQHANKYKQVVLETIS